MFWGRLMPTRSWLCAVGNMTSCEATAFIGGFGYIGSPLYNCSLATYYSLQLKYNWQDRRMERIQKWFHIVPCSIALLYCTTALCTKTFGPSDGFCGYVSFCTFFILHCCFRPFLFTVQFFSKTYFTRLSIWL